MGASSSYQPVYPQTPQILVGVDSTFNAPFPDNGVAAQIAALFPTCKTINNCINGLSYASAITNFPTTEFVQFNAAYARNINIFTGGSNDIGTGASAATTLARIAQFWALNVAAGIIPIVGTIIANGFFSPPQELIRLDVNTGLRNTYPASQLADMAANVHFALPADTANLTYYYDTAHPTVFGGGVLAGIYQPLINAILTT